MVLRPLAVQLAGPDDVEQVIAMAFAELRGLHEAILARHRLRPSEFQRWRDRHQPPTRR